MKFTDDDIREACSDIRKEVANKLNEDFSADNIEYRQEYENAINQLENITNDNKYFESISEIVLDGYDDDLADYIYNNHLCDIIEDEAQEQIEFLEENCNFDNYDEYAEEDY